MARMANNTQSARGPLTGGSSSPRRSRPRPRLAGPSRISSGWAVGCGWAALGRGDGDGARGVERSPPLLRRAGNARVIWGTAPPRRAASVRT